MANITGAADERVFQINKWLGLNENPDGDTKLKMGEASAMRNFRVTRDGNLQKRPGTKAVLRLSQWPVGWGSTRTVWHGFINGIERIMAVQADRSVVEHRLVSLWSNGEWTLEVIGSLSVSNDPCMFGFDDKLYILTGSEYYVYDGTTLSVVSGYVPLVATAVPPDGGGELLEQVNKLTAKRRAWFSPDGTKTKFQLPEKDIQSVVAVRNNASGNDVTGWTADTVEGTVEFTNAPVNGVNTLEIEWEAKTDFRSEITAMHFSEIYNGSQDTRVFLYGDGSNTALYSDVDYNGKPNAEYFPDQNEVRVGAANTPITGMIRHYGTLAVYKTDGAWSINYGAITLADGTLTSAFYVTPVNAAIGNEAPGQVQLVLNSPVTLFGQDVYEWRNSSYYTSNLTRDERQARRMSDRVYSTLHSFDTKNCKCFDDNYNQEYYICNPDGRALVWNYAVDAWYLYTDFCCDNLLNVENQLYSIYDGVVFRVSTEYASDETKTLGVETPIDCYWESGAMSFGRDYQRKYSAMLWVGIKPDFHASVDVTVVTDRSSSLSQKEVKYNMLGFEHMDFSDFTFLTNDKPQMKRLKIKAKKFVFYKLIFKTDTNNTSVTVTSADIRVRFTGYSK
jgi:hypothetical protein